MSKAPARFIRNSAQPPGVNLHRQWRAAVKPVSVYTARMVDSIFKALKRAAVEKIVSETSKDKRLSCYDEMIYERYKGLMDVYRQVSNEENAISGTAGEILNGIYSVVSSRVKLFEENRAKGAALSEDTNPIAVEKKTIITSAVKTFCESFDNTVRRFNEEKQGECVLLARRLLIFDDAGEDAVLEGIMGIIDGECFRRFWDYYDSTVQFALINLNDLYKRRETRYYYDLLLEEREILSSIVNIQLNALAHTAGGCEEPGGLREAYNELDGTISEINAVFKHGVPSIEEGAYESFRDGLLKCGFAKEDFGGFKNGFRYRYDLFLADSESEAVKCLDKAVKKLNIKSSLYEFSKLIYESETLAEEITHIFAEIMDYYGRNSPLIEENGIIHGIAETVEIKIESIRDNTQEFSAAMSKFLSGISVRNAEVTPEERVHYLRRFKERLVEGLIGLVKDDKREQAVIRGVCFSSADGDGLDDCRERLTKLNRENADSFHKKLMKFKKDSILYEISTFEEILNYSVSVLRKEDDENVRRFVEVIDCNAQRLYDILTKHSIDIIKPEPHDLFNGKEHEVLTAELNPDFKKGEIIRVMNCGYRQKDVLILRANVIAAL